MNVYPCFRLDIQLMWSKDKHSHLKSVYLKSIITMNDMNWTQLLSGKRFGLEEYHERKHERTDFQRDYDRLIFSSPFRRLQKIGRASCRERV